VFEFTFVSRIMYGQCYFLPGLQQLCFFPFLVSRFPQRLRHSQRDEGISQCAAVCSSRLELHVAVGTCCCLPQNHSPCLTVKCHSPVYVAACCIEDASALPKRHVPCLSHQCSEPAYPNPPAVTFSRFSLSHCSPVCIHGSFDSRREVHSSRRRSLDASVRM
jgi:hypothetical protein